MAETVQLTENPTFARLEEELNYYSGKSRKSQKTFKRIKVTEILAAAFIPFLGSLPFPWLRPHLVLITGGLGVLITVLEGVLHLNQYQENWTNNRATAEALKHEKFLFLAHAGPYAGVANPEGLLAERIEALISQESQQWTAMMQKAASSQANK